MYQFRLLSGSHTDNSGSYEPGDIITTEQDLRKLNSIGAKRYELLTEINGALLPDDVVQEAVRQGEGEEPPVEEKQEPNDDDDLEDLLNEGEEVDDMSDLTVEELRKIAEDEGINLGNRKKKAAIISAIQEAREG